VRRLGPIALASSLAAGCAAAPAYRTASAPPATRTATVSATGGSVDGPSRYAPPPARESPRDRDRSSPEEQPVAPGAAPPAPSVASAPSPTNVGEATSVSAQGAASDDADHAVRESRIGAQVQRIREEQIRLAANPDVCRDVCFAAGSICLAAQEVCRLTGDDDARCARARGACADAGRQRDGACPVCPPTH
jgi:hypothetical protein